MFNPDRLKGVVPTKEEVKAGAGGAIDNWLTEYVIYPTHGLVALPSHLTYGE